MRTTDHDLLIKLQGSVDILVANQTKIMEGLFGDEGLCVRMAKTETKQSTNRLLINTLWGFVIVIIRSIIGLFVDHVRRGG